MIVQCATAANGESWVMFHCPGCDTTHGARLGGGAPGQPKWMWNGDHDKPTILPSVITHCGDGRVCHCFVRDGQIEFCGDSWHDRRGTTMPLPSLD